MLEMLKERKAALEAQGKKGFTLMEMLIVIAIIAILIAIAIPVFTGQMRQAELATDTANVRSAYSEAVADVMLDTARTYTGAAVNVEITDPSTHCTATVNNTTHEVTVTHKSDNTLKNTFEIDSDVTLTINQPASGNGNG